VTLQYFIDHQTEITRHTVPVGFPVEDTEIVLLDSTGAPTAVVGEIAICSPYVAQGYWRQPELTQNRFLPNAHGGQGRLYRTGDMGRFRPDGMLEFVGRTDHQVKIRGFRIELGEVESVLSQHPAVRHAVVLAYEDVLGDKRLIAYLVLQQSRQIDPTHSRAFLGERLPADMVPTAVGVLDTLPQTPTGKLDRRALPPPSLSPLLRDTAVVAPRTPIEAELAQMWMDLLGLEQISVHENFFALGGHSLLAIRVMSRVRDTFHIELPPRSLIEVPTVAGLAERVETLHWTVHHQHVVPSVSMGDREEIAL
jgi:acyl carrier protein